jgi:hypothetical protein
MELVELLRQVVDELAPFVERGTRWREIHDPGGSMERLVKCAEEVLDGGLLIGRGVWRGKPPGGTEVL